MSRRQPDSNSHRFGGPQPPYRPRGPRAPQQQHPPQPPRGGGAGGPYPEAPGLPPILAAERERRRQLEEAQRISDVLRMIAVRTHVLEQAATDMATSSRALSLEARLLHQNMLALVGDMTAYYGSSYRP